MQDHPPDQLHVEVTHGQHAAASFSHDGEGLGEQVVEAFPLFEALLENRLLKKSVIADGGDDE